MGEGDGERVGVGDEEREGVGEGDGEREGENLATLLWDLDCGRPPPSDFHNRSFMRPSLWLS